MRLHCVISGFLAGGRFGFRAVLCCFPFSRSSLWPPLWSLTVLFGFVWPPFQSWGWRQGWYNAITTLSVPASLLSSWSPCPLLFVLFLFVLGCCLRFFSVRRLLASARSFNTFDCMLQQANWLITAMTWAVQWQPQQLNWRGPIHSPMSRHNPKTKQEKREKSKWRN